MIELSKGFFLFELYRRKEGLIDICCIYTKCCAIRFSVIKSLLFYHLPSWNYISKTIFNLIIKKFENKNKIYITTYLHTICTLTLKDLEIRLWFFCYRFLKSRTSLFIFSLMCSKHQGYMPLCPIWPFFTPLLC